MSEHLGDDPQAFLDSLLRKHTLPPGTVPPQRRKLPMASAHIRPQRAITTNRGNVFVPPLRSHDVDIATLGHRVMVTLTMGEAKALAKLHVGNDIEAGNGMAKIRIAAGVS